MITPLYDGFRPVAPLVAMPGSIGRVPPPVRGNGQARQGVIAADWLDKCQATGYSPWVKIRNFVHKGLQRLYLEDRVKGVPPDTVDKLRKMLAYLEDMEEPEELRSLPARKAHMLRGGRKGAWSLHVTRNRRLTFRIDSAGSEICDVNFEDCY
jgi:proteic killer suppression protein